MSSKLCLNLSNRIAVSMRSSHRITVKNHRIAGSARIHYRNTGCPCFSYSQKAAMPALSADDTLQVLTELLDTRWPTGSPRRPGDKGYGSYGERTDGGAEGLAAETAKCRNGLRAVGKHMPATDWRLGSGPGAKVCRTTHDTRTPPAPMGGRREGGSGSAGEHDQSHPIAAAHLTKAFC